MTDDRASLGARIAEAMGWEWYPALEMYIQPAKDDDLDLAWALDDLTGWAFYGEVDAWMREQGYSKKVEVNRAYDEVCVRWYDPEGNLCGIASAPVDDEPLAAITSALEARE